MRSRLTLSIATLLLGLLLSACNMTLASDITPPPNYIPPTPIPTLGALHPAAPPDIRNGQAIYVEKCMPCHGQTGLGDGAQGKQLPVTVAALGLPQVARPVTPARWYTVVSQGNIDRFMPPFTSLTEQERWDVVAYSLTLHTSPGVLEQGRALFDSLCAGCPVTAFTDQVKMSSLSEDDLVRLVREGGEGLKPFGASLSDEETHAAADHLRSLSFAEASSVAAASPVPTEAAATAEAGTPSVTGTAPTPEGGTPLAAEGATEPAAAPAGGVVSGTVTNKSGSGLPSGLKVTLRGFDHISASGGPEETLTLEGTLDKDGAFRFEGVEFTEGRLLLAELDYKGINYQTPFASLTGGEASVMLEPITVYETTSDYSALTVDQLHVAFDFGTGESLQVFEILSFTNPSGKAILIKTDGTSMPFLDLPAGATNVGFEAGQDSAPYTSTADGLALLPTETPYSLIAFYSLPYDSKGTTIVQPMLVQTDSVTVFAPEGIKLKSQELADQGVQNISGSNFQMYSAAGLEAGSQLSFSLSGKPDLPAGTSEASSNRNTLIYGAGALGLALIGLGGWMYLRDRKAGAALEDGTQVEDEEDEFDDPGSVMDAIIALDDLHRAKKIPDEAYQQRRAELKEQLRKLEGRP